MRFLCKSSSFFALPLLALFILLIAEPCEASVNGQDVAPAETENRGLSKLDEAVQLKIAVQRLDDLENVIELCQEAIEEGLNEGHLKMAQQLMSATLYERASHLVSPILQGQIDNSWIIRRKKALDDLDRATSANPNDGEAFLLTAQLHELPGGESGRGLEAANRAVELLAEKPERYSLALTIRASFHKDVQDRLADYDAAIDADKTNTDAWRERGRTKLAIGDAKTALEDFRHLLETDESDVEAMQAMGEAMASLGQFDEALETLNKLVAKTPNQSVGYAIRARVLMAKGELDAAEEDLNQSIKINPRDLIALMMRTRLRMNLKKFDLALGDANRILELRPGLPQAILLRSLIHSAAKDYANAARDLKRLLRRDPKNVEIRLQLASVYSVAGQPRQAIEMFSEILNEDRGQLEALRGRGDAYLSIGAHAEAVADYDRALQIDPKESGVLNNLAWVLATSPKDDVRDGARAIAFATRACEVTQYKAPHILSTLAAGYAESGDFDTAIEWSTKAVEMGQGEMKEQLREELESYQIKKPWREQQEIEEPTEPVDIESDLVELTDDDTNDTANSGDES